MKINVYEKLSNPTVLDIIDIKEWFDLIRESDYTSQIIKARNHPETIEHLKKKLPCVTYNFLYRDYKKDENTIKSTGILFIDIDNPQFDITRLDKKAILGYYKSLSGIRYHILVKTDGVTQENFKSTYLHICKHLDLEGFIDKGAIKQSQFSVLSHDTYSYYNENPIVHLAVSPSCVITKPVSNCIPIVSNIGEKRTYTYDGDTKIRYNNLNEIVMPSGEKYITNWDGYEYIQCWIPIHKLKDGRKRFLLSYTSNFVWLNPSLEYERYLLILQKINQIAFDVPLPNERIISTLNSVIKQLKDGRLQPIRYRKMRKIIFNPDVKFDKGEKQDIVLQELAIRKTNRSIQKLKTIIQNWDFKFGKITARNILKASQSNQFEYRISYKVISKYYKHFKNEIAVKNKELNVFSNQSVVHQKAFDVTLGGLYKYDANTIGWNHIYLTSNKTDDDTSNTDKLIVNLKEWICRMDLNEATSRKEFYEAVDRICQLDAGVDFDKLYLEMLKHYNNRKKLA